MPTRPPAVRPGVDPLEPRLAPALRVWAADATDNWSVAANWVGGVVPGDDDEVLFSTRDGNGKSVFDGPAGLDLDAVEFGPGAGPLTLTLNTELQLDGGDGPAGELVKRGDDLVVVTGPGGLRLAEDAVTVDVAAGFLDVSTPVAGTAGLVKRGPGFLRLFADNPFTGPTRVEAGTLQVFGDQKGSPVAVAGGRLGGAGRVGPLTLAGGLLAPAADTPDGFAGKALRVAGSAVLSAGTFAPTVRNGAADRLDVAGTVTLNGAALLVTVADAPPAVGTALAVIANDGTDPVVGTFVGLPEGATLTTGGRGYRVSYTGGDGNDVVLTALGPAEAAAVLAGGPPDGTAQVLTAAAGALAVGDRVTLFAGPVSVRTAVGDVNGDGVPDLIGATGPGAAGEVAVLSGAAGRPLLARFRPFGDAFTGGLYVTAADFTGDGRAEVAVAPDVPDGKGFRPEVRVYDGASLAPPGGPGAVAANPRTLAAFLGLAGLDGRPDDTFGGGARLAAGDVNRDGVPDLAVAAGNAGGPRVTVWNGAGFAAANGGRPTSNPIANLFVFEARQRGGAFVTAGDVTGDGAADLAFGGGPNGGPRVRVVDSARLLATPNLENVDLDAPANLAAGLVRNNFFAGDGDTRGGVRLAVADVDGDALADLVAGSGDGQPPAVRVYTGKALGRVAGRDGNAVPDAAQNPLDPFARPSPAGVFVG